MATDDGGSLFNQFSKHKDKSGMVRPELNYNGKRAVELSARLSRRLGLEAELLSDVASFLLEEMSKEGLISNMTHSCKPKNLPDSLRFGFMTYLPSTYRWVNDELKLQYSNSLLGYNATVWDTQGTNKYDSREMLFKPEFKMSNAIFDPPLSHSTMGKAKAAIDAEAIRKIWNYLVDTGYPLVGFTLNNDLTKLLDLTKELCGEDEFKQRREIIFESSRVIDLSTLITRMEPSLCQATFSGLISAMQLTPPTENLESYSLCVAEMFNYLLDMGYRQGLFSDYDQLVGYISKPVLLPICPIGRYRGKPWKLIPTSIVSYYMRQDWIHEYRYRDFKFTLLNLDDAKALYSEQS